MDWHRRPSGLLVPPEPRIHRARYCDLFGGSMMGALLPPETIRSQATTTQTLVIPVACTMDAKLWGAGATYTESGRGAFAGETFSLQAGDVVTYAAGGPPRQDGSGAFSLGGTSGSGLGNGGDGTFSEGGAGRTELFINGVLALVAAGGAGRGIDTAGGPGGDLDGRPGISSSGSSTGGQAGTQSSPGDGGVSGGLPIGHGNPGSGGNGGKGGINGGGGGGGGYRGGGGGAGKGNISSAAATGGGSGSSYTRSGTGTLTAASTSAPGNAADPDRINNAGDNGQPGAVVLKFTAT